MGAVLGALALHFGGYGGFWLALSGRFLTRVIATSCLVLASVACGCGPCSGVSPLLFPLLISCLTDVLCVVKWPWA